MKELVALVVEVIAAHCRQGRFLFNQLHTRLFPSEPTVDDMRLRAQISRFSWLRPRHLDLPRSLSDTEQAAEAVSQLRHLHELH
ncbi:hypothetical protein AK812_SmicGene27341 [Symbiodinium microadriaticum]|uniref:Uncharacterized protein n=1 Tax=Symbiodinium microadriaticum TaxID=2951 RepID=A0A1Q9D749_SYMMI|nr:hypothetical protein AK812_SmicGene27341 [Symbiodinium microadriaticum]